MRRRKENKNGKARKQGSGQKRRTKIGRTENSGMKMELNILTWTTGQASGLMGNRKIKAWWIFRGMR